MRRIFQNRALTFFFSALLLYYYLPQDFFGTLHAETHMEFEEYVESYNYPVQRHEIITHDGYILILFRIQAKYQSTFKNNLPVVYLQHGLLDSSDTFILNEESKAPAFMLANRGYDVWMGNFRGNKHSRSHIIFDPDSPNMKEARKYWEFSFHEMGTIDIPAIFEFIHSITYRKINFIGHSQGSMAMMVALCEENPIILKYVRQFIALGPIAYIENITSPPLKFYQNFHSYLRIPMLLDYFGFIEFVPSTWFSKEVISRFCNVLPLACSYGYGFLGSDDPRLDSNSRYDVISAHVPAGTSLKNMWHFDQLIATYEFKQFDYGPEKNMKVYNQTTAPFYDLSKIKIPVALFLGTEDRLSVKKDVDRLRREMSNSSFLYYKEIHSGHTSFMWGKDMSYFSEVFFLLEHHDLHSQTSYLSNQSSYNTTTI